MHGLCSEGPAFSLTLATSCHVISLLEEVGFLTLDNTWDLIRTQALPKNNPVRAEPLKGAEKIMQEEPGGKVSNCEIGEVY